MKLPKNSQKLDTAFTLVELQISSAIAVLISLAIISLYIFSWRSFAIGDALLDVYLNSRNASSYLTRDIRSARQIEINFTSPGGVTYTTGDSILVLKIPSIDNSNPPNDLSFDSYYDHIIYQLQGSDLHQITCIDTKFNTAGDPNYHRNGRRDGDRIISTYCRALTFQSPDPTDNNEMKTLSQIPAASLSALNTVAIELPINKSTTRLSGSGTIEENMTPTTIVRLRNK